jgi:hypothetical protein
MACHACRSTTLSFEQEWCLQTWGLGIFYEGWKLEQTLPEAIRNNLLEDVTLVSKYSHSGATRENLFPDRQGSFDADVLRKLGLTKQWINDQDALFFYQLCFPWWIRSALALLTTPGMHTTQSRIN